MQKPEIILDIFNKRSKNNLKLENLYKNLYNPEFYINSYKKLSNNNDLSDSILNRINNIINELKQEKYKWCKDFYETKSFNRLNLNAWRDTLLQDVIYTILNSIYEAKFYEASYGYRFDNSIGLALSRIYEKGQACEFFIRFDVMNCFECINKEILINILKENINDNRFIFLIQNMFKFCKGMFIYKYDKTYSGTPISYNNLNHLLLNIYLNELDHFIVNEFNLRYNRLQKREWNLQYSHIKDFIYRYEKKIKVENDEQKRNDLIKKVLELKKERQRTQTKRNINESDYRRFYYIRHVNNCIIPFTGTFDEAKDILLKIKDFVELKLKTEINNDKICKADNDRKPVNFLQYNIITQWSNEKNINKKRNISGQIAFMIPNKVITKFKRKYMKNNKVIHLAQRLNDSEFDIISIYQEEYKGICQYYKFARNQYKLGEIRWVLETSLTKTLAHKLRTHVTNVYKRFHGRKTVNNYSYKVLETSIVSKSGNIYTTYFGAIPLRYEKYKKDIIINDLICGKDLMKFLNMRSSNTNSLIFDSCDICGSTENLEIHHLNKIKNIDKNKPNWLKRSSILNRKVICLCKTCHNKIHNGSYNGRKLK